MNKQKAVTMQEILEYAKAISNKHPNELDELYLYTDANTSNKLNLALNDLYYFDDTPDGDENDEDVFSAFVMKNKLEVVCAGFQIIDVVSYALHQKPNCTIKNLLESLDFYLEMDTYLEFNKKNNKEIKFILMPNLQAEQLYYVFNEYFGNDKLDYNLISQKQGLVFYTYSKKFEVNSLAHFTSIKYHSPAIMVLIKEGFWSHYLYNEGNFCSPANLIMQGQERKKKPKMEFAANVEEFIKVFPQADHVILDHYLYHTKCRALERNAAIIKQFYISEGITDKLYSRNGEFYVQDCDRFAVGDYHQAFDFMRYIGYDLPVTLYS